MSRARDLVSSVQTVTSDKCGTRQLQAPTAAVPTHYTLHCSTALQQCSRGMCCSAAVDAASLDFCLPGHLLLFIVR